MKNRVLRTHASFVAVLTIVAAFLVVHPPTARAGSTTTTNACFSNATATYSDLGWSLAGTGAPNPAAVGADVTLGGGTVGVDIPATLLIAGYNLGLLTVGVNSIPTTVYVARSATNATPSTQVDHFAITATTTISDPNGVPGTGDETATPLAVSQPLPDMVVTAIGGTIAFSQAAPGTLPLLPAGVAGAGPVQPHGSLFASASVAGGLIRANFDCFPGHTNISDGGTSGPTYTPATPSPFEQVTVTDSGSTTTTDGSSSTSSTSTSTSTSTTSTSTTSTSTSTTSTTAPSTTTTIGHGDFVTGTASYTASCTNSVTPDKRDLTFAITGTAPASVVAGSKVALSDQSWTVDVPASVLQTGINLGLLSIGQTVNGTVSPGLFASNTAEGSLKAPDTAVVIGPIEADANGQALPASATFAVGDVSWTSVGGDVAYSFDQTKVLVEIGPLKVTFTCQPPASPAAIVVTTVTGQTDIPPAGRTTTPATVEAATVTAETLPVTGIRDLGLEVVLALVLLDAGYLLWSATRPPRRRRA